jgi:hypothetical protein
LRGEAAGFLLDESFLDIDVHFADLLTSKWMTTTDAIDTVCATLVSLSVLGHFSLHLSSYQRKFQFVSRPELQCCNAGIRQAF